MSDPNIRPSIEKVTGVPTCTREECPSYDGKRCRMIGHRPESICEPAVIGYVVALRTIARDPHCAYPEPSEPSASLADSQYKIGVADGHRCAAEKARVALGGRADG